MVTFGAEMVDPDTRRFCFPATKNLVAPGVVGHHHPFIRLGEEKQKSPRQLDPPKPIQMNGTKSCVFQVGKIPDYETTIQATGKKNWVKVIISSNCLLNIFRVGKVIQQFLFHLRFPESDQLELDFEGVGCFFFPSRLQGFPTERMPAT